MWYVIQDWPKPNPTKYTASKDVEPFQMLTKLHLINNSIYLYFLFNILIFLKIWVYISLPVDSETLGKTKPNAENDFLENN